MNKIREIAKTNSIEIIEDACHALQAEYFGERCGGLGRLGCFSFIL